MCSPGFSTLYKPKLGGLRFADLLDRVSGRLHALIRRPRRAHPASAFGSHHLTPKIFPTRSPHHSIVLIAKVLDVIGAHRNVCKSIHLPAQSGSSAVLERMRRGCVICRGMQLSGQIRSDRLSGYSRTHTRRAARHAPSRRSLSDVTLSSDFITGFCGEKQVLLGFSL